MFQVAEDFRVWPQVAERWRLDRFGHAGITALFAGDPGTGKTLAAEVIAAEVGLDLMVVDLSLLVSKWIGETEKNLDAVFTEAGRSHCVLFFDEADTLFGRRGEISRGADRYANLEVGYLLQRLDRYEGLVVLATNLRDHLDEAFTRRFQHLVHFPNPGPAERRRMWELVLGPPVTLDEPVDLDALTALELTGAAIAAIVRSAALAVHHAGRTSLRMADLREAAGAAVPARGAAGAARSARNGDERSKMIDAGPDARSRSAREPDERTPARSPIDEAPSPPLPLPGTVFAGLIGEDSPALGALWEWARLVPPLMPMSLAVALGEVAGVATGVLEAPAGPESPRARDADSRGGRTARRGGGRHRGRGRDRTARSRSRRTAGGAPEAPEAAPAPSAPATTGPRGGTSRRRGHVGTRRMELPRAGRDRAPDQGAATRRPRGGHDAGPRDGPSRPATGGHEAGRHRQGRQAQPPRSAAAAGEPSAPASPPDARGGVRGDGGARQAAPPAGAAACCRSTCTRRSRASR